MAAFLRIASGGVFMMCVLVAAGCGGKPEANSTASPAPDPKVETPNTTAQANTGGKTNEPDDLRKVKADVVMPATKMAEEFANSRSDLVNKYNGKVIEISGTVERYMYTGRGDIGSLIIEGPKIIMIECDEPHPMAKAMPGQKVILRGRVNPLAGIAQWTITSVEGEPPVSFTVEQLTKALVTEPKELAQKLKKKYLIISGQIEQVKSSEFGTKLILTKEGITPVITCGFAGDAEVVAKRNKWFTQGQPVRILAHCERGDVLYGDLDSCVVLPPNSK